MQNLCPLKSMARRVFIRGSMGSSSIEWRCHCQGLAAEYEPAIFYAWSQSHQWHWLDRHRKVSEVTKRSDICRTCSDKQTSVKNKSERRQKKMEKCKRCANNIHRTRLTRTAANIDTRFAETASIRLAPPTKKSWEKFGLLYPKWKNSVPMWEGYSEIEHMWLLRR